MFIFWRKASLRAFSFISVRKYCAEAKQGESEKKVKSAKRSFASKYQTFYILTRSFASRLFSYFLIRLASLRPIISVQII